MKGPIKADLWSYWGVADAICITTNGSCDRNGDAIMGKGVALAAKRFNPGIEMKLGEALRAHGNITQVIPGTQLSLLPGMSHTVLVALPTKPGDTRVTNLNQLMPAYRANARIGSIAQGWKFLSTPELVGQSLGCLAGLADFYNWQSIVLTPPGAGNGGLDFNLSMAICKELLDDRFTVVMQ